LPSHHHVPDLLHGLEFTQRAEGIAVSAPKDGPSRSTDVGGRQGLRHLIEGQAVGIHEAGIHLHLDLTVQAPGHRGLGHSVQLFQASAEDRLGGFLGGP